MHIRNHYANELRRNTQINYANHYADYANTDFNYAEILVITQWATCSVTVIRDSGPDCTTAAAAGPGKGAVHVTESETVAAA